MHILSYFIFTIICATVISNVARSSSNYDDNKKEVQQNYRCIDHCSFTVSFDDISKFVFPAQCQARFQSSVCHIELKVDYQARKVLGAFNDHGDHAHMSADIDLKSGVEMEVREATYNFNRKMLVSATWINFCATSDECDRSYLDTHLSKIVQPGTWNMFENVSSLMFSSSSSDDVQCYKSATTIENCMNQEMCHYAQDPKHNNGQQVYTCKSSIDIEPMMFFQTHRSKTSVTFSSDLRKFDILDYSCNVNKCNSPANTDQVKNLINLEVEKEITNASPSLIYDQQTRFILLFCALCMIFLEK